MSTERYDFDPASVSLADRAVTKLLYISISKYDGDWNSLLHTHACTEIFYVLGGTGRFCIQNETRTVSAGDMVIVNPNVAHAETSLNATPMEYVVIGIDGSEAYMGPDQENSYLQVSFRQDQSTVVWLLRCIIAEARARQPGYELICQDLLEVLIVQLLRRPDLDLVPSPAAVPPGRRSSRECAQVKRYIDSHFKENISLDLLAKTTHINKYYLSHSFSKEYGVSPINYLILRRIEESKRLLTSTDHSLSQISHLLGFSSPSYFSQSFRRIVGVSPMEYRKNAVQKK